jgi:hypothetical protein
MKTWRNAPARFGRVTAALRGVTKKSGWKPKDSCPTSRPMSWQLRRLQATKRGITKFKLPARTPKIATPELLLLRLLPSCPQLKRCKLRSKRKRRVPPRRRRRKLRRPRLRRRGSRCGLNRTPPEAIPLTVSLDSAIEVFGDGLVHPVRMFMNNPVSGLRMALQAETRHIVTESVQVSDAKRRVALSPED